MRFSRDLRDRGTTPEIPTKRNRKMQHPVNELLYKLRSRTECFIGHLKEQRRVATRYDKTASSFLGYLIRPHTALVNHSASSRVTRIRSDLPSNPMPGRSGILM
jgi:hypothetical protein